MNICLRSSLLTLCLSGLLCALPPVTLSETPATATLAPQRLHAQQAYELLKSGPPNLVVLDVRTDKEFAGGHVPGAVNLDILRPDFIEKIRQYDRQKSYLVYCRTHSRSTSAVEQMRKEGFTQVYLMDQGFLGWNRENLPLEK